MQRLRPLLPYALLLVGCAKAAGVLWLAPRLGIPAWLAACAAAIWFVSPAAAAWGWREATRRRARRESARPG